MTPASGVAVDERDLELLRFLLEPESEAVSRWQNWTSASHIDDHSSNAFSMFPAVHKRLGELRIEHEWTGRLKGVHRRAWTNNQLRRSALERGLSHLSDADLEILLPADVTMLELSTRGEIPTLNEPRLTVRDEDIGSALAALLDHGWAVRDPTTRIMRLRDRLGRIRWKLDHPSGDSIVLTVRFDDWIWDPNASEEVWSRSTAESPGVRSAHRSDLLLTALTSGAHDPTELSWVLSALAVLESDDRPLVLNGLAYCPPAIHARVLARLEFLHEYVAIERSRVDRDVAVRPPPAESTGGNLVLRKVNTARRLVERWGGVRESLRYLRSTSGSD